MLIIIELSASVSADSTGKMCTLFESKTLVKKNSPVAFSVVYRLYTQMQKISYTFKNGRKKLLGQGNVREENVRG